MGIVQEYKLSAYQDYGPLGDKNHIHLVIEKGTGRVCVKKVCDIHQKEILDFRRNTDSVYFPELIEAVETEGQYIIIEEYVEGITLEDYMAGEVLPENEAVQIAGQIGNALACLHQHRPMIVYRDLKAENVMILRDGHVKLVDFDISRQYQEGKKRDTVLMGTAEYAAPEQFGYFQTDNRTDIYAFGVLFNYMLTGKFPVELVTRGKYESLIRKCIELEPDKRYQRIEDLLAELASDIRKKPVGDSGGALAESSWKIPGFRSGKLWKAIVAVLGYGMIFYMGLTTEFHTAEGVLYSPLRQWLNRVWLTAAQIAWVLFVFNYRGISDRIKVLKQPSTVRKVLVAAAAWFVFLVVAVVISSILESILGI